MDNVNQPSHYTSHPSGVECIDITRHMNFCLGNAIKYIWRAGLKGDSIEDLKKAKKYIDFDNPTEPTYDTEDGVTCVDTVKVIDGNPVFCCPTTGGGAYAWRHNEHCEVVGSIYDN